MGFGLVALGVWLGSLKPISHRVINNRRALHEYTISAKLECGIVLLGSEVKSLRAGKAQLSEAYARVENGQLVLHQCHIDPYEHGGPQSHEPVARGGCCAQAEIKKLADETNEMRHDADSAGDLFQGRAGKS